MSRPDDVTPGAVSSSACLICGYSLAGLADEATCPECEANVGESRLGHLIARAPAHHVELLATGARLAKIAAIAIAVTSIVESIAWLIAVESWGLSGAGGTWDRVQLVSWTQFAVSIISLGLLALASAGWWQVSSADERFHVRDRLSTLRLVLRAGVVVSLAGTAVSIVADGAGLVIVAIVNEGRRSMSSLIGVSEWMGMGAGSGAGVAMIVSFFAIVLYVRGLALRLGSTTLRRSTTRTLWAVPACLGMYVLSQWVLYGFVDDVVWTIRVGVLLEVALVGAWLALWVSMIDRLRATIRDATSGC
jgi:hypothetical protein